MITFQKKFLIFCLAMCCSLFLMSTARANQFKTKQEYIDWYGEVSAQNKKVQRAQEVLQQLLRTSKLEKQRHPELTVLPKDAEQWLDSWAMLIPDGSIIVVESVLDFCFGKNGDSQKRGNARLAFILGHEIGHSLYDLNLLQEKSLDFTRISESEKVEQAALIENRADHYGFLNLMMAEYDPQEIIQEDGTGFFTFYERNVRKKIGLKKVKQPVSVQRGASLREKITQTLSKVEYFQKGIQQYDRAEYDQAISSFQKFHSIFPSREVSCNLGLAYHQKALQVLNSINPQEANRFQLSSGLGRETLLSRVVPILRSKEIRDDEAFQTPVQAAKRYIEDCVQKDPNYLLGWLNLSATAILAGEYNKAKRSAQKGLQIQQNHPAMLNNLAIANYLLENESSQKKVLDLLEAIPKQSPFGSQAQYNLQKIRTEQLQCEQNQSSVQGQEECHEERNVRWKSFSLLESPDLMAQEIQTRIREKHVALVIGNQDYRQKYNRLETPRNDARGVKSALEELGFEVELYLDLSIEETNRVVHRFAEKIQDSDVALFYYSGHAVQVEGQNYLIPPQAVIKSEQDIPYQTFSLNRVLDEFELSESRLNIAIIDACRTNNFKGKAKSDATVNAGLSSTGRAKGTYIAYATSPGDVALERDGDTYSLYTGELLKYINRPNLKLEEMFKQVRNKVKEKTRGSQIPWDSTSVFGEFYFNPGAIYREEFTAEGVVNNSLQAEQSGEEFKPAKPKGELFTLGLGYSNLNINNANFTNGGINYQGPLITGSYRFQPLFGEFSDWFALQTTLYSLTNTSNSSEKNEGLDLSLLFGINWKASNLDSYLGIGFFSEKISDSSSNLEEIGASGWLLPLGVRYRFEDFLFHGSFSFRDGSAYGKNLSGTTTASTLNLSAAYAF